MNSHNFLRTFIVCVTSLALYAVSIPSNAGVFFDPNSVTLHVNGDSKYCGCIDAQGLGAAAKSRNWGCASQTLNNGKAVDEVRGGAISKVRIRVFPAKGGTNGCYPIIPNRDPGESITHWLSRAETDQSWYARSIAAYRCNFDSSTGWDLGFDGKLHFYLNKDGIITGADGVAMTLCSTNSSLIREK